MAFGCFPMFQLKTMLQWIFLHMFSCAHLWDFLWKRHPEMESQSRRWCSFFISLLIANLPSKVDDLIYVLPSSVWVFVSTSFGNVWLWDCLIFAHQMGMDLYLLFWLLAGFPTSLHFSVFLLRMPSHISGPLFNWVFRPIGPQIWPSQ